MYEQFLIQSGLSKEQALVYQDLIKEGFLLARKISQNTGLKRGLVYKTLEQLVEMGLVEKREDMGKVAIFHPTHPSKLKDLLAQKEKELKTAETSLQGIMNQLVSDYNLFSGKPNVQFFEGLEGMKRIYDDILETGKDFCLIRAHYEPIFEKDILPIVEEFIKRRVKNNIRVVALTPKDKKYDNAKDLEQKDAEILFDRTWIDREAYIAPVEIDIYGNKVALLSFGKELVGTIIESQQVADAFQSIFTYMRDLTQKLSLPKDGVVRNVPESSLESPPQV